MAETAIRLPALPGGMASVRLVYFDGLHEQVIGFEGHAWATAYQWLDLSAGQVIALTPTEAIATADGRPTGYQVTVRAPGARHWDAIIQVPDSVDIQELDDLVGAAAIDPDSLLVGRLLPAQAEDGQSIVWSDSDGEWAATSVAPGREVSLQTSATHIQWQWSGAGSWTDLIALSALTGAAGADGADGSAGADGREIELQKSATHVQWRYVGGTTWTDLVALADITGPQGATGAQGPTGPTGPTGADGTAGVGVPAGGSTGQVLAKNSNTDYDTEWVDAVSGGSGATNLSVASKTSTTLDIASDTGTDATIPAATADDAGLMTAAQYTKLSGIEASASAAGATGDAFATSHLSAYAHGNIAHGETAYGWGNHASAGYLTGGLTGYTVATLPTGTTGAVAYVTDASSPVLGSAVSGGGSTTVPVFYDGTAWIADIGSASGSSSAASEMIYAAAAAAGALL